MKTHSARLNLGDIKNHCENYDRLEDYAWIKDNFNKNNDFKISLYDKPYHYMSVYRKKTIDIELFFEQKADKEHRFLSGNLYDKNIYAKIANFLNIKNPIFLQKKKHTSKITTKQVIFNINAVHNELFKYDKVIKKDSREKILQDLKELCEYLNKHKSHNNYNLLRRVGEKYIELNNINDAEKYIKMGIEFYKNCPKLYYLLAKIKLLQNKILDSEFAIKKSIEIAPDNFYIIIYTKK